MDKEKIPFDYNGKEYIIWAWKGNYLNLGAGAEVGFYKKNYWTDSVGVEHWIVDREFPMTLSLYNNNGGNGTYSTYYNWMPHVEQWWITGFVPNIYDYGVTDEELSTIASIDFSHYTDMYEAVEASVKRKSDGVISKENIVFA